MKILTAKEMARIENVSFKDGFDENTFMEQAGLGIANTLLKTTHCKQITLLVSKGNNSGDAYVTGRLLLQKGYQVVSIEIPSSSRSPLCEKKRNAFIELNGKIESYQKGILSSLPKTCFLDGLFGTGFKDEMKNPYAELCSEVNASKHPIISIDIPSGLNGSTGIASNSAIKATHTFFLGSPKLGFFIQDGPRHIGKLSSVDFGLPKNYMEQAKSELILFEKEWISTNPRALNPQRHKYDSGSILCYAGSEQMPGAALLSCMGALRSGAGIVYLHTESKSALPSRPPELIISEGSLTEAPQSAFKKAKALIIGPGLDETEKNKQGLINLLQSVQVPSVIDAGALNLIASGKIPIPRGALLTPHIQEMHRLLGFNEKRPIDEEFLKHCQEFAKTHQITLLLKGSPTFIFHKEDAAIAIDTACAGLAKAGTGDVLCGILASFLSRGHCAKSSAILGTYLHALAGKAVCNERSHLSLTASDLIDKLPYIIKKLLSPVESYQEDFHLCLS